MSKEHDDYVAALHAVKKCFDETRFGAEMGSESYKGGYAHFFKMLASASPMLDHVKNLIIALINYISTHEASDAETLTLAANCSKDMDQMALELNSRKEAIAEDMNEYIKEVEALTEQLQPLAGEAQAQKIRMREAQRISVENRSKRKTEVDSFIRKQYAKMQPQLKSGEMQIKEVNAAITTRVEARFTDPSTGNPLVISQSRIDRALGKKK